MKIINRQIFAFVSFLGILLSGFTFFTPFVFAQTPQSQGPLGPQTQPTQPQMARPLSGQEIVSLLSGRSTMAVLKSETGGSFIIYIHYKDDGSNLFETSDGLTDTGRWYINDKGEYCSQFNRVRRGQETCSTVSLEKDVISFHNAGKEFKTRLMPRK